MSATIIPKTIIPKHSLATRIFHHGSIILLAILWASAEFDDEIGAILGGRGIDFHRALGVVFLFWVILRLVNVAIRPKRPTLPAPKWQTALAHLTHLGLYLSMLAMPICGILMSLFSGRAVSVFGWVQIPVWVTPSREWAKVFDELHTDIVFAVLLILVGLHVVAGLYHQFILKDKLLNTMR